MKNQTSAGKKVLSFLGSNSVPIMFIIIVAICIPLSGFSPVFLINEIITRMGRNILAVGGNVTAAERVGISKTKTYLLAFGYLGALTGLAGAVSAAKLKTAQPSNGIGYEMDLIAAVIIGGTQFTGGICSVLGTVLGVLLLGVIQNGLVLAKIPVYWQSLATGVIIIVAVASSGLRELKHAKKNKKEAAKG